MWPKSFADRLESWNQLRNRCTSSDYATALSDINQWWFNTPWIPYHLHWDERSNWPDPWQLLSDNLFCSLARGLGIMYTIALIDRADMQDSVLIESDSDNLVLIGQRKYILNWEPNDIVNISLPRLNTRHSVDQNQIKQQLK